jgi:hypothetical protein
MRIPIKSGRWFAAAEALDTANKVILVSEALAARLWPGQNAVGHRIRFRADEAPTYSVIGVTGNVKHTGLDATRALAFYIPERQWYFADNTVVVAIRTAVDPSSLAPTIRRAISSIDPSLPIIRVSTMEQLIARTTAQRRLALILFAAFASAALLLAVAGIYGVLAGNVAERTRGSFTGGAGRIAARDHGARPRPGRAAGRAWTADRLLGGRSAHPVSADVSLRNRADRSGDDDDRDRRARGRRACGVCAARPAGRANRSERGAAGRVIHAARSLRICECPGVVDRIGSSRAA